MTTRLAAVHHGRPARLRARLWPDRRRGGAGVRPASSPRRSARPGHPSPGGDRRGDVARRRPASGRRTFVLNAALTITRAEPPVDGSARSPAALTAARPRGPPRVATQGLSDRAGGRAAVADAHLRGRHQHAALGPEGGVHARVPRHHRAHRPGGRLPGGLDGLAPAIRPRTGDVRRDGGRAGRLAPHQPGQRHVPRRGRQGALGLRRRRWTRSTSSAARCTSSRTAPGRIETLVYLHETRRVARRQVPGGDGAVPRDVPEPDRPVSLRQVRAGRELLGNGLRDADLHAARPAGHPLPVHHQLVVPARDPAQLVGQLGVRRLRHRQLVRGPHGLHGRSPDPGAARRRRRVPALDAAEVPRLRAARAATSRSPSSAGAPAPPPRPSATARR